MAITSGMLIGYGVCETLHEDEKKGSPELLYSPDWHEPTPLPNNTSEGEKGNFIQISDQTQPKRRIRGSKAQSKRPDTYSPDRDPAIWRRLHRKTGTHYEAFDDSDYNLRNP